LASSESEDGVAAKLPAPFLPLSQPLKINMHKNSPARQWLTNVLIGLVVLIWLMVVVVYWLVASNTNNKDTLVGISLIYLALWGLVFLCSDANKFEKVLGFFLTTTFLTLLVSLFEMLVLIKVVDFRLVFHTPITELWRHPENLLDSKLLHIHRPHYRLLTDGVDYQYDRHGFRNQADLETADIIVIGDSFIEGWNVSSNDLLTSHLARDLDLTIANLGQSWYGPQQELEVLRRFGLPLHPKVCVWTFYDGNDLLDVRRYEQSISNWKDSSRELHSFRERSFTRNLLLAVRRLRDSLHHDAASREYSSGIVEDCFGGKSRTYFLDPDQLHLSAADDEVLKQIRVTLNQAYELCRINGIRFVVVFAPTKFRVYKEFTTFDLQARPRYWVINDLPQRLGAIVRESLPTGEFLDLTPTFIAKARCGSMLYGSIDTHWSPEGHRVAAAAIAQLLRKSE
jgi:SGNH hydrolase-like domain, acetyltransferase AlgX